MRRKMFCYLVTFIVLVIPLTRMALAADYNLLAGDVEFPSAEQMDIPIFLENNNGFMGFAFEVSYNPHQITPISVEPAQLLAKGMLNDNISNADEGSFKIIYTGSQNVENNGELFLLHFSIAKNQVENICIGIRSFPSETFDETWKEINFYCEPILINCSSKEERAFPTEDDVSYSLPELSSEENAQSLEGYNEEQEIVVQQIGSERVKSIIDKVMDEEGVKSIDRIPENQKGVVTEKVLERITKEANRPLTISEENDEDKKTAYIKRIYEISCGQETRDNSEMDALEFESNQAIVDSNSNVKGVLRETLFLPLISTIVLIILGVLTICFVSKNRKSKTKGGTIHDEKK